MTRKKWTDWKIAAWMWFLIYLISLVPIVILGFYNFPCADDLGYSIYTRHAWLDTHSIFSVLKAACQKVAESYHTWQGTWSSIFLMALQPGVFGEKWYGVTVLLMTGVMSVSVFYLFHCIFVRWLGGRKAISIAAASIVLLVAIQCMVDKTQAFFWYNGAVHYILPQSGLFVLMGIVLSLAMLSEHKARKKQMLFAAGNLLTALIGGGNYVTGLECGIWLATAVLLLVLSKRGEWKKTAVFLGVWALSFGINAAAPGNFVRESEFAYRPGVIRSILQSFYYCLDFVFQQWMGWEIVVLLFLIAPFVCKGIQDYSGKFQFRYPLLVVGYSFCILSSMFTPSVFASGIPGAGRIYNIIYLTHLLLLVINMIYLYGWYWVRYGGKKMEERHLLTFRLAAFGAAGFIFGITAAVNIDTYTSVSAVASILSGEAAEYQRQQEERLLILENPKISDAVLREFSEKPYLLFYEDIEEDTGNWKNLRMSSYYRKNTIRLNRIDEIGVE
ncbi:MAG: DUF6056 family protein [Eisenbergiella sp.]